MGHKGRMRLMVAVLMAGSLAACGGADDDPGSTAPSSGDGPAVCTEDRVGGEVTVGTVIEPAGLDPVVTPGTGVAGGNEVLAIYDTLVRYNPENDTFEPQVAESLEPNADFTEWTLKLRDEVTFGNGDPLTADVVKESFARHQSPDNRAANFSASQAVTEMQVVDPLTLVFKLDSPWPRFPFLLADLPGMITNPTVVAEKGDTFNVDPVGAGVGPYEVERFVPGEELVLRAKENWWGGPVCIETLRFTTIVGGQATYDAFRNGDLQVAMLGEPDVLRQARDDGVEGFTWIDSAGNLYLLNHTSGATADPLVRQALAAAIDPQVIDQRAANGHGRPTTALIDEASVYYDELQGPEFDPDKAADLVEQAKADGWDGQIEMYCQNTAQANNNCLAFKAMAEAAGMSVAIESMSQSDLITRVYVNRDFSVAVWPMAMPDAEPWVRMQATLGTDGTRNSGGYSNPEMDAALQAFREGADVTARQEALATIQEIWNEDIPAVVYSSREYMAAIDPSVKGLAQSQIQQFHFDKAYIDN